MPSVKILESKKAKVADLAEKIKNSCAGVIASYQGINVLDDTILRKKLRESNVEYIVVKNTLLKRASEEAKIEGLEQFFEGSTAIAISQDHVIAAKILCDFVKDHNFYVIKSGYIDGKAISKNEVEVISQLPPKEVLIAKVLGGFNAPIAGFANVLQGTMRGLVVALNAIAQQKTA